MTATVVCETRLDLTNYSLGVVVNRNAFVCHTPTHSLQLLDTIRVLFQNDSKRVKLQFKTFEETVSSFNVNAIRYNFRRYEFLTSYANIASINLFGDRIYLNLRHPALLHRIINEREYDYNESHESDRSDEDWDEPNTEKDDDLDSAFESDEDFDNFDTIGLPFIDNNNFCGLRVRVNTFNNLNAHMFTKTNSICMRFERNNENDVLVEQVLENIRLFTNNTEINIEILREEYLLSFADIESAQTNNMFADLPFNIKYLLQAINAYSYRFIDSLSVNESNINEFKALLDTFCKENIEAVEQSLSEIYETVQNGLPLNPLSDLRQSFAKYNKSFTKKWANESIKYVRRCILTPTRLLLLPALPQQQSRSLRTCDPEYAIRLLIKDEDLQLLSFTACSHTSIPDHHRVTRKVEKYLQKIITNRVKDGLVIGGRTYEFVGASTSQLRDHGLILYARDKQNRDAKQICELIGKLGEIRNPAKLISKIGLSMSQSMGYITLSDANNVLKIKDIEGGVHPRSLKPYTFSDGVGMISKSMALKLAKAVNRCEPIPSTYQIRYAGCKGVVVINPELEGDVMKIRPSMTKFESDSLDIDILKMSEPRSVYLNRPLITILEAMGVPQHAFQQLLFDRLKELCIAFRCNCNAVKLIKSYSNLKLPFKELIKSGINLLSEPFFVNVVESIVKKVSRDLKNKARILVPLNESRIMFGVIDETKSLNYGEVFVQYTDDDGSKKVLLGEILVTKYPCMHGGDVRKFKAIKVHDLMHVCDCIVFPAVGDRPHADEMAGSDLDGDEYSVIWRKSLIFERPNHAPMDFPCGEASDLGRTVTTEDVLNFYCTFIQKNQVGVIASSHLAWADFRDDSIFCKTCRILDYKYATALDFAKTGKNDRLRNCDRPTLYPNFMMKNHEKPTYTSVNALGKLFEMNCYFNDVIEHISEQTATDYSPNAKLIHKNAVNYFDDALNAFERYKSAIKQLRAQFGVESECALLSGSFIKAHKYVYTQNDSDSRDLMSAIVDKLFMDFLILFEGNEKDEQILLAKASAWYQISHSYNANAPKADKYFGFPWIISKYLLKLIDSSDKSIVCCNHNSSQLIVNISKSSSDPKEIIQVIMRALIFYSENEHLFLLHVPNIKNYLEHVINRLSATIDDNNYCEKIMEVLRTLSECAVEWSNEETKLKIGLVAMITRYRLLRCDNNLKRMLTKRETQFSDIANSLVISEKLSELIKARENEFISHIKAKIKGIKHILVRYRHNSNSTLTVVGTQSAVKLFTYVLYDRHLSNKLEDNVFFKQNISCKARYT